MKENPLSAPQREKSGAKTFGKYEYQYHWALYRVIDEQKDNSEYALFIELHEDVVVADSLDVNSAQFEFNQIKNVSKPKYNIKNLVKRKDGKNSVLGKLIKSSSNKKFTNKIKNINLVASCGFQFELKEKGLELEEIRVGELSNASLLELKKALNDELGSDEIPCNLKFVIPKLHIDGQQDFVIARIADLVDHLFPGSHCSAVSIYRMLIDDLHRKGEVANDYTKWDELLKNKALTSNDVRDAIQAHTTTKANDTIMSDFDLISHDIGLKYLEKKDLRRIVERLNIERIGFPTSLDMAIRKDVNEALIKIGLCSNSDISIVLSDVNDYLSDKTKKKIGSDLNVKARIIYEIITSDI